jgi:glycosyltransferase involved in cell wall biosynthesis
MSPKVSVIVCTYNNGRHIGQCIESILEQTFKGFELIVVNDASTDNTHNVIASYSDSRIKYVKLEKNSGTIGKVRNISIGYASGEYIFFTDGDCHAKSDWLERGIEAFEQNQVLAIEGRLVYYKENYHRTLADRDAYNETGNLWMTANMAFHSKIFETDNFNPDYPREEDREFALRIMRFTKIPFIRNCVVYHQKIERDIKSFIREVRIIDIKEKIRLVRLYNDENEFRHPRFHIYNPLFLLIIFFPPIILAEFFIGKVRSWSDFKLLPFLWVKAIYMRYLIWKTAIKERYFVL